MSVLEEAVKLLIDGDIVIAPTETVYGLFGDATSDIAIQKIYTTKGRPSCNPLIIHVSSIDMALTYAELSEQDCELINHFWYVLKAPITFVVSLKKTSGISSFVTAGLETIAIRRPNHPISLALIEKFGKPLAAPSANTSSTISPTSYEMVMDDLGKKVRLVIDGGQCSVGLESTILDISKRPYKILRHGGVSPQVLEKYVGERIECNTNHSCIKAPGMMKKHYAPSSKHLRINAAYSLPGEAFIAFGKTELKCDANLSENGDLYEAARNLFSVIKKFDNNNLYTGIAIMPIPSIGIGKAINDRIERASYVSSKKVLLIILDGFGIVDSSIGNATSEAKYIYSLFKRHHGTLLDASEEYVGLPHGQFGNSEVGHLTIGTGRVVKQKLPMITEAMENGDIEQNQELISSLKNIKTCNIMGLFSNGGIHSYLSHFFYCLKILRKHNIEIKAHLFLDGRDVAQDDALKTLEDALTNGDIFLSEIATIQGRYFAMDRDKKWERTDIAYDAIKNGVSAENITITDDPVALIRDFYQSGVYDENILPIVMNGYEGASKSVDSVFWMVNYRTDRVKQILHRIVDDGYRVINMVSVDEDIDAKSITLFKNQCLKNNLGEVVSSYGLRQLRLAETEKYAHVTYFFNGGEDVVYKNEDRILVPSPNVSDYASTPDMSAQAITEKLLSALAMKNKYDLIVVNYANADMIGHTGNYDAAKSSLKSLDTYVKRVVECASQEEYDVVLTADHGNAEQMINKDKTICKTHTCSKVPFIYVPCCDQDNSAASKSGSLQDIAPTILKILRIDPPKEMTGKSLI